MDDTTPRHGYQDDTDTTKPDEFANEAGDQPADELGIPLPELKRELDDMAFDDQGVGSEDMRETIEDRDEDDDNSASNA